MPEITELPPSPEPKKETVKVRSRTLKEHFEVFLNKNNLSGWVSDVDNELGKDTIGGILLEVMTSPGMDVGTIRQTAHRICELTRGHIVGERFSNIGLDKARRFVYEALGYPSERKALEANSPNKHIKNIGSKDINWKMYEVIKPQVAKDTLTIHLHLSEVGNYTSIPKRVPTGRSSINPTVEMRTSWKALAFNKCRLNADEYHARKASIQGL